jgi:hypothetical protein
MQQHKFWESTRPMHEIIGNHVIVLSGHAGLKLVNDISMADALRVLDWTMTLIDSVRGYMVGDAANFGYTEWGKKYGRALDRTGRATDVVQYCARMSALIPLDQRKWIGPLNLEDFGDDGSGDTSDWWKRSRE